MTHNAKSDNIDAILESGNLIAPSFAITKKDYEVDALSKFGDVTFIRKPEKIEFGSDNIYNRDIYSPRMPRPEYQLKDGTVIDSYEKEAQERLEKEKPERYEPLSPIEERYIFTVGIVNAREYLTKSDFRGERAIEETIQLLTHFLLFSVIVLTD